MRGRIPDHRGLPHYRSRDIHRRRDSRADAVLHQHGSPGRRAPQPAGNRERRALRALFAIRQISPPALPGRVPRRDGNRRPRPGSAARPTRRQRSRRQAVSPGAQRVRGRLRRATRRRTHRLRRRLQCADQSARVGTADGLSRAIDPLRAVHRSPRRTLEVSRAGGTGRLPAPRHVHAHDGSRVRDLRAMDPGHGRALPREVTRRRPRIPKASTRR